MKPNYFLSIAVSVIFILCFTTCKKYPEDPFISLRTVKMRMEGEWQFEKIEINGEDVVYKYNDSLTPLRIDDFYFWFKFDLKNYGGGKTDILFVNKKTKNTHDAEDADVFGVGLAIHPKKLKQFWIANGAHPYVPQRDSFSSKILMNVWGAFQKWDIKRLYKKKMIMENEIDGSICRLYFKKTRS